MIIFFKIKMEITRKEINNLKLQVRDAITQYNNMIRYLNQKNRNIHGWVYEVYDFDRMDFEKAVLYRILTNVMDFLRERMQ